MFRSRFSAEIFLLSLAAIALEVSYTRIFSFKLFYYFTFLTIGIALLGIGSGGVIVAVSRRLRAIDPERLVGMSLLLTSVIVLLTYMVVVYVQLNALDIADSFREMLKLVVICGSLFTPFFLVGVCIATIFGAEPERIGRLYFADLVGAGIGCAVSVPLFNIITPPGVVMLSALLFAIASFRLVSRHFSGGASATAAFVLILLPLALFGSRLPDPVTDRAKTMSPQRKGDASGFGGNIIFSRWSTVFRVDVSDGPQPDFQHMINHDGNAGSTILRFDGDFARLRSHFDVDLRSTPFSVVKDAPRVLIIGSAGGHEILASLYYGASHVTAVELNPVTVSLLTDHFADYSGRLPEHERVTLVNGEGRSFIKRSQEKYDIIWFVAPDSYAAMNAATSGAFVLSESYLYTQETILDSLARLNPGGVICLQTGDIDFARKPNRSARYLVTARAALARAGMDDFQRHALVASTPEMFTNVTILIGKDPFTPETVARFHQNVQTVQPVGQPSTVWNPPVPGTIDTNHPVYQVVTLDDNELQTWLEDHSYGLYPVDDDSPFFWHFVRFRDVLTRTLDADDVIHDPEDSKGERVLLALLVTTVLFSAAFLLLPLIVLRDVWSKVPFKTRSGIYFASLGLGFMFFEICLIQKLTLFLGYPSYSLTVTLFAILIFSGIGSLLSESYSSNRGRVLAILFACLTSLALFYHAGIPWMVESYIGLPLAVRMLLAVAILAPLGLCLGAFMPIGLRTVAKLSDHGREYVAWAWAVNGFFSVTASSLATILSMSLGFKFVLTAAVGIYAVGILALTRVPAPRVP